MSYNPLLFLCLCIAIGGFGISLPAIFLLVKPTTSPVIAMLIGCGSALVGVTVGGIVAIIYADRFI